MKTRVAIIIEVKKRELPFFCLLREFLRKENYEVELVPFHAFLLWKLLSFKPNIIIINGLRTTDPQLVRQIYFPKKIFKSKILCYYSEQIGVLDRSLVFSYDNPLIMKNVDMHVSWGPRFSKDLIKEGIKPESSYYIGSMQYDLDKYYKKCEKDIKQILSTQFNLEINKKWIIYADNIVKRYLQPDVYKIRRTETVNLVLEISKKVDNNTLIIFRTHPDTSLPEMCELRRLFDKIDNVRFISEGHIFDWAKVSSALIMRNSSSSLQAMFLNKPILGFRTSDKGYDENYWYKDIFPLYDKPEFLIADLLRVLKQDNYSISEKLKTNQEKYISDWYYKHDGLSFNRMISLVKEIEREPYREYDGPHFSYLKLLYILMWEIYYYVKEFFVNKNNNSVSEKEIQAELEKYDVNRYEHVNFETKTSSDLGSYLESLVSTKIGRV